LNLSPGSRDQYSQSNPRNLKEEVMSRRLILTFAAVAALASTALVVSPAFAGGGHGHGGYAVSHGGKSIRHASGHLASRKMHASHHTSGKSVGLGHHKSGKALAGLGKKDGSKGKFGNGTGKLANAPGKLVNGTGKLGNGPGKLANGPGKLGTGPNSLAGQKLASANSGMKMGPGAGKTYHDQMGQSVTTTQGGAAIGLAVLESLKRNQKIAAARNRYAAALAALNAELDFRGRVSNTRFRNDWGTLTPDEIHRVKREGGSADDNEAWRNFTNDQSKVQSLLDDVDAAAQDLNN
jgi:hypothetical protein